MKKSVKGSIGLKGNYTVEVLTSEGEVKSSISFPNLITVTGLNKLGKSGEGFPFRYCTVGTGNTPPTIYLDGLVNKVNTANATYTYTTTNTGSPLYQSVLTYVYTFPIGAVVATVAELGVSNVNTGLSLFSRALIVDSVGNPTTVTVLAGEQLRVSYQLTVTPPLTDVTGTVTIGGVPYAYTLRAANVGSPSYWIPDASSPITSSTYTHYSAAGTALGSVTAGLPGTNIDYTGWTGAYDTDSFTRTFGLSYSIDQANLVGGLGTIGFYSNTGGGSWKLAFSPALPKDATNTLSLSIDISWA